MNTGRVSFSEVLLEQRLPNKYMALLLHWKISICYFGIREMEEVPRREAVLDICPQPARYVKQLALKQLAVLSFRVAIIMLQS